MRMRRVLTLFQLGVSLTPQCPLSRRAETHSGTSEIRARLLFRDGLKWGFQWCVQAVVLWGLG